MEILIVTALIGIISVAVILLLDPWAQINKAHDAKRKHDLAVLQKSFEDYYSDKGCYPQAEHLCFDVSTAVNVCAISKTVTSKLCHICGLETAPPKFSEFSPYLNKLPCDPQHPSKDYLLEVERPGCARNDASVCAESTSPPCTSDYCPQWYRVYADFSYENDKDSELFGCKGGGCGPAKLSPPYGFDYGVSSHQVGLQKSNGYVCVSDNSCNACQSPRDYNACVQDPGCPNKSLIYGTVESCCAANPSFPGC